MKFALIAASLVALIAPVAAQEVAGRPLIRVYIDDPYFYDILLTSSEMSETGRRLQLAVEGKEVGASTIDYDCSNGDFTETMTTPWTGGADAFIPAALKSYDNLFC